MLRPLTALALTLGAIGAASASSGDAWAEFAAEVETSCREATADLIADPTVVVDPFGSETYGLAIVSGETTSVICVFDKQDKTVEIGGELDATITPTATP